MAYVIKEKYPDGDDSVKQVLAWIENIDKTVSDSKDIWTEFIATIKQTLRYEFSDANPNNWPGYKIDKSGKSRYLEWKRRKGFPDTIGIMSGALKKSLVEIPRTEITKKKLQYAFNPAVPGYRGKMTGKYAKYFDKDRPIFGFTKDFLKLKIKDTIVAKWLRKFRKVK